jgi:hypothetical protein
MELKIECEAARIEPNRYNQVWAVVENPRIPELLSQIPMQDLLEYVRENYGINEVYPASVAV